MNIHNHTKEYSIAIILNAIARAKFNGETQKDIANLIGVGDSNIPKYKSGEQKLSPTNINLIIEKYGFPKLAAGSFMQAEIFESVNDYVDASEQRCKDYLGMELTSFFRNKDVQYYLASSVSNRVLQEEEIDSFISMNIKHCSKAEVPEVLNWLEGQISKPEFEQWYKKCCQLNLKQTKRLSDRSDSVLPELKEGEWSKSHMGGLSLALLYLLGYYTKEFEPGFKFDASPEGPELHMMKKEVVVTGESILEFQVIEKAFCSFHPLEVLKIYSLESDEVMDRSDVELVDESSLIKELKKLSSFSLEKVSVTLKMNKDMVYRMVIDENWSNVNRNIVITEIRQDLVIEDYKKISEFFCIPDSAEIDLKRSIASRGGFIPGALVL